MQVSLSLSLFSRYPSLGKVILDRPICCSALLRKGAGAQRGNYLAGRGGATRPPAQLPRFYGDLNACRFVVGDTVSNQINHFLMCARQYDFKNKERLDFGSWAAT